MYKLKVKVWGQWFNVRRSQNKGIYKVYTDDFCTGFIVATDIEEIEVVQNEN